MLQDHNRMAAYHSAILGNPDVFRDAVVLDIGTGSGILAVWAAQAGAKRVYAIEYTDMAKYARQVMQANQVDHIVTVLQCAVEDLVLPGEEEEQCVDIIVSEWMGYFLLRESMMDSIIRARDRFLKPKTGLMFPSHCTMYLAAVTDEDERKAASNEYAAAMSDWNDFENTVSQMYGVNMNVLESDFDREQMEYYIWSSRWTELPPDAVLAEPAQIRHYDMITCTLEDARGIDDAPFDFDVSNSRPISGLAGWFTADFTSRTDAGGVEAPLLLAPSHLSTGPENGYTHWGQQTFYFPNSMPVLQGETVRLRGSIGMMRTKENARLYNCRLRYRSSRRRSTEDRETGHILMESAEVDQVYQIP